MIVFSPWRPLLDRVTDYLARAGLIILLLIAALSARRSKRYQKYWQILFGLLLLTIAVSLDFIFSIYLIDYLGVTDKTPAGWAIQKLNESIVIICVIILFIRMSGGSLGSILFHAGMDIPIMLDIFSNLS